MSAIQEQKKSEVWASARNFIAGYGSGIANVLAGHSFDTVKVRLQTSTRFKGPLDCVVTTVREEGFRGLYKGVTPPMFGMGIINSCMFAIYDRCKKGINTVQNRPNNAILSIPEICLAGMVTGWGVSFVVTPIELIKAKLQVQYALPAGEKQLYTGSIDCARKIVAQSGVSGLYRGFTATIMTRSHCYAYFGGYEVARRALIKDGETALTGSRAFFAGGIAGTVYWLSCFPFDVIKNRIMVQQQSGGTNVTARDAFVQLWKSEGMRGFWRGFVPCMLRTVPANGVTFLAFEMMMKVLPQ